MAEAGSAPTLTRYDIQKLLPNVPPGEALKNLFFQLVKRECPELIRPGTKSIRDVLALPGNVAHVIRHFVNDDTWIDWCSISHALVLAALDGNTDTDFVQLLSDQCVELILSEQSSKPIKRVGLSMAITLSKVNPSVTNRMIWGVVFKPTVDLMHSTNSSVVTKLSDMLNLLDLYSLTLELPVLLKRREFYAFQTNWIGIASIYSGICDYLRRPVLENDEFLKQVKHQLEEFIIKTIMFVHELHSGDESESGQLAQFLISLIIGTKKGTPVFVQLVETGDSGPDSFQRMAVTNQDLAGGFSARVTNLFDLCSRKLEERVAKELFAQLMSVGSKLSPNLNPRSSPGHEFLDGPPSDAGLDLTKYDQAQNYVSLLFLSEFGSSESYLDSLISNIESDENSFTFLKFAIERMQQEIEGWEARRGSEDPSFPFSASLVQSLEMIETLCTATYEEENQERKGSSDDQLKKSLIGWSKSVELLPFLRKIQNIQHPFLIQTGIPTKCEELIIFITTRGRGVRKNLTGKEFQGHGTRNLQEVLFSLNSGTPSSVGMGLITLKKLIHARDPGVETHFEFILTSLENLLKDDDEYVYNHTINVIVSLTLDHHQKLLPRLIQLYAFTPDGSVKAGSDPDEAGLRYKLKIGEVISKIFGSLGPIAVKYVNPVMNAGWSLSSRENVTELRMSAYQVVTSLVPQLGHSLEEYILGIWHWAGTKLEQERDVIVKVSIWGLCEKLLSTVTELTKSSGVVPPATASFVKEIYRVSKEGQVGEDERLTAARERIRFQTQGLTEQLLSVTSRKFEQVKIL